jgi:hypothetical protein
MTNPMQGPDPQPSPDPVTPRDTPSNPAGYAQVTPHGVGAAWYDIQAPMADLTGAFEAAGALSAGQENDIYGVGPRQSQTAALLQSPQGFATGGYDINAGWSADWPNDVEPDVAGP